MTATQLLVFPPESSLDAFPSAYKTDLPDGWRWVKLGEIVDKIFDGPFGSNLKTADYVDQPGYQVIRLENIGHMEFIGDKETFISEQKFYSLEKNEIYEGDIVFSSFIGETVRTTVVPKLKNRAINKADCFCIRINAKVVDRHFVVYALSTQEIHKTLILGVHGATRPRINTTFLKGYKLPLPPLAEQHRIVVKIEELFSEIDAGVTEIETALARLKIYRQAVLHYFLSNPDWERVKLGEIASVTGGITKNSKREILPLQVPYLRVANVYANRLDLTEIKEIGVAESEISRTLLKYGDLLVVEGNGSIEQVGRVALWKEEIPYCLHQNHLIKIRFENPAASVFLLTWLISPLGREAIEKQASSTSGLHTLSISKIAGLTIPFPDLATQTQIVQEIEARLSEADALEKTLRTELLRAGRLRQSVLKQAFQGKLV